MISRRGRRPVRGVRRPIRGREPPTFGENVCENERVGFRRGGRAPGTPPRSANDQPCDFRMALERN